MQARWICFEDGEDLSKAYRGMAIRKGSISRAGSSRESGSIKLHHERIPENCKGNEP
jgi:hypothetical protein